MFGGEKVPVARHLPLPAYLTYPAFEVTVAAPRWDVMVQHYGTGPGLRCPASASAEPSICTGRVLHADGCSGGLYAHASNVDNRAGLSRTASIEAFHSEGRPTSVIRSNAAWGSPLTRAEACP